MTTLIDQKRGAPQAPASIGAGLLILRLIFGLVFILHGWQKITDIPGTGAEFAQMGILMPAVMAVVVAIIEFGGGILVVLGVLTRPAAVLILITMVGAGIVVHLKNGFFSFQGGYEYVLVLSAIAATIAISGPGRYSLASLVFGRGGGALKTVLA